MGDRGESTVQREDRGKAASWTSSPIRALQGRRWRLGPAHMADRGCDILQSSHLSPSALAEVSVKCHHG